ncbi:hypothetical protein D3C76_544980 [compost metagenome]|uniref:Lipoprotein n=1 Tax=Pseudomonas jinjuensis TaxID=198616 RepID=A0A1H0N7W9_9PSED|nr:DUF3299 domain-containing protein [Pseudomonas jinjuensis]SDO88741.1 hypothetical protein SAMN05216193_117121 [Pseudomonas jinjuensis]
MRPILALLLVLATCAWAGAPRELTWSELIPADAPPLPPPVALHDFSQLADALAAESGPAARQQSRQVPVVRALDGLEVKLPGYIVPLEVDDAGEIGQFLLVPYYGACIHVPPPPPNQIVYVRGARGVKMDDLYQPFWVEGRMRVEAVDSDLALAGYQLQASSVRPYDQ